jgi:glucan phosphoethanolaminetransferase (alkaline phosphatase superfamily)
MTLIFTLGLIALLSIALYHRASWNTALGVSAATLLIGTFAGAFGLISWVIFLIIQCLFLLLVFASNTLSNLFSPSLKK